ncbi:hypothetical protein [Streptomyces sp. ME19-01-6]|uniref:hypothetical protein n=1 Tax=Streptomyces sp. ME19-01-6 TaxID=3028686 RepID=UPI0029BC363E|nr:hypothetical protein [Streptomyces sp. ME19-01-6]MDX3232495.1 hypothetical protein [Streptomyces sp. ME19-01-6]
MAQNPAQHARVAADALTRLANDVRTGRAQWPHTHTIATTTDDITRIAEAMATATQQLAAALGELGHREPRTDQAIGALHQAGQSATTAAHHLRRARQTMH